MSDETTAHQHVLASAPDAVPTTSDEAGTPTPHGASAARGRRSASPFVAAAVGAVILGAGSAVTVQAFASDGHPVQSQNQRGGMGGPGGMGGMGRTGGMGAPGGMTGMGGMGGMGGMQGAGPGNQNGTQQNGTQQNGTQQNGTQQNGTQGGTAQNGAPGGQAAPGGTQQNAAPGA